MDLDLREFRMQNFTQFLEEAYSEKEKQSSKVKTNWEPPFEGFFNQKAEALAKGLLDGAKGKEDPSLTAIHRLTYYINRHGTNLSDDDKARLHHAMEILKRKHQTEKS